MRVLVATDGSTGAGIGVDLVASIEWPVGTSIRVIEVVEPEAWLFGDAWPLDDATYIGIDADLRQRALETTDVARSRLARSGVDVSGDVISGRPASSIVQASRDFEADLIVVGSRGHGTLASMLLGSVSAEVIDHAPIPVLVARTRTIGGVVLGWDGSDAARLAAELVGEWPIFDESCVHVVSVTDARVPWWTGTPEPGAPEAWPLYVDAIARTRRASEALATDMAAGLARRGLDAVAELREGDAATELAAAARGNHADLIVVGTRGRTGLPRLVLGSVARNVLHHATCSVMVVPVSLRAKLTEEVSAGSGTVRASGVPAVDRPNAAASRTRRRRGESGSGTSICP